MESLIGSCLFESHGGGIHSLLSGDEGTGSQHFDLLGVTHLSAGVDHLLPGFQELLRELSELEDFSFNEWIPQSSDCVVDELLIWLAVFEDALSEGMERGLSAISRSSSQFDGKNGMSPSHSEEGPGAHIVQYELHVLGFAMVVVGVMYGRWNTELSI